MKMLAVWRQHRTKFYSFYRTSPLGQFDSMRTYAEFVSTILIYYYYYFTYATIFSHTIIHITDYLSHIQTRARCSNRTCRVTDYYSKVSPVICEVQAAD
jgi:hypothetical protein